MKKYGINLVILLSLALVVFACIGVQQQNLVLHHAIELKADTWAKAMKTREGKHRYEMMTDVARKQFIKEQQIRSGMVEWFYNIGYSSPHVTTYKIKIDQTTATIDYEGSDSAGGHYKMQESVTFVETENGDVQVNAYRVVSEWR